MSELTETDITFIYEDLKSRGLTLNGLIDEMVDHICCIVEPSMEAGVSFSVAYNQVLNQLDKNTFSNIQHQTILSTNLKFQNMKKTMIILGALGTALILVGTFMKSLHLPGAGISLTFGVFLTVFGFLPLFFYTMYKEQTESKGIYLSIIGYLTSACLLLGVLFRLQHWPWTHNIMLVGQILLVVAFLPVYLMGVFRKAGKTNTNLGYVIIIVGIGIAALYMSSTVRISKDRMDEFDAMNKSNIDITSFFEKKNDSLFLKHQNVLISADAKTKIELLKRKTQELNQLIIQIETEMLKGTGNTEASLKDFEAKDNERICDKVMDAYAFKLSKSFGDYKRYVLSVSKDDAQKYKITNHLEGNAFTTELHNHYYFGDMPLIEAITHLTSLQKSIALAENEILTSL